MQGGPGIGICPGVNFVRNLASFLPLVAGQDYTIDYTTGQLQFKNPDALFQGGVSQVRALADASVSCSQARDLAALEPRVWHARGLGDFWQHVLVAEGALDAAVDTELALWDRAALEPIVAEAGGRVGSAGGQFVSSNGLVLDEVLAVLSAAAS